jgi:hypothetical protein
VLYYTDGSMSWQGNLNLISNQNKTETNTKVANLNKNSKSQRTDIQLIRLLEAGYKSTTCKI